MEVWGRRNMYEKVPFLKSNNFSMVSYSPFQFEILNYLYYSSAEREDSPTSLGSQQQGQKGKDEQSTDWEKCDSICQGPCNPDGRCTILDLCSCEIVKFYRCWNREEGTIKYRQKRNICIGPSISVRTQGCRSISVH